MIFSGEKFCQFKKSLYLCTAILESTPAKGSELTAKVAQLVEHDLAKVGVAGPSPVFRSSSLNFTRVGTDYSTIINAKVAQLVEHDLAKVGVAGPSPVFRSLFVQVAELVDALL